jgi:battenin
MGGATYVNAFYLLSAQVDDKYKEFSLGLTSVANSVGISLCAVTAIFLQPWMRAHQHHKYI